MVWKKLICLLLLSSAASWAASISWTGSFVGDNEMFLVSFTLPTGGDVTIQTWGYGGGVNAAGVTIPAGGFAPALALFESWDPQNLAGLDALGGTAPNDCTPIGLRNPDNGSCLDALIQVTLAPGSYFFTLTQQGNTPSDGTFGDGFTGNGSFLDPISGNERTKNWAVDLVGPDDMQTGVPEPAAALPLALALMAGFWRVRRRSRVGV